MVEDRGLGGARRPGVVVAGDRVEELVGRVKTLEQAQTEVDVAEELSLLRRREDRRWPELSRPSDVVDERGCDEEVGTEPRVDLAELAAERCDADCVLEQPAGVRMVAVGRGGI